ncbi:hypothetical protein WUBG_13974 [Wuchereria bancrofti]|uniref:Uncharacterized protein n=1 Tax=Wuchereria bancrofti TaxID=6293 RepID=J9DZ92_WUCBA|nr:hypothetical protein WUBG_13974 [Wuchereria bancrofti]
MSKFLDPKNLGNVVLMLKNLCVYNLVHINNLDPHLHCLLCWTNYMHLDRDCKKYEIEKEGQKIVAQFTIDKTFKLIDAQRFSKWLEMIIAIA